MRHRRRGAVEPGVGGQRQREDVLPHPEADEHVQAHGDERLEVVGHRRLLDPQQLLGQRGLEVGGDAQRDLRPAEEHRPVDREVAVVRVVERVEPDPALARDVLLVDLDRAQVRLERALVVAAQHVDVRRHVHQVAGVGDERAQLVGDRQRLLGERRHLHQVHVEVHESGGACGRRAGRARARAPPWPRASPHPPTAGPCSDPTAPTA